MTYCNWGVRLTPEESRIVARIIHLSVDNWARWARRAIMEKLGNAQDVIEVIIDNHVYDMDMSDYRAVQVVINLDQRVWTCKPYGCPPKDFQYNLYHFPSF